MTKLRKKIFIAAGYNTISLGPGRKEFHPKKYTPALEETIREAGQGCLKQIGGAKNVDEVMIGNFMAPRFNKQGNLAAFAPMIDSGLHYKPATRVEGACASGGLAVVSGIRSVLSETADVALVIGFEIQNTVKSMYGADILAGAGWYKKRREGHAYFFPGQFSDRAGHYYKKYDAEKARKAMAIWYENAIKNARLCSTAQEYQNTSDSLLETGMKAPNPNLFVDWLNYADCSKISDGASSLVVLSEEGLKRCGVTKAVEVLSFATQVGNITEEPNDPTVLDTMASTVKEALQDAEITLEQLGTIELHDCFSIVGILALESIGVVSKGEGPDFIIQGHTTREGKLPINTTGGLIGWGHPTGATGVHQAVTIWEQLTEQAGEAQITLSADKPYGMSINMGGDDKTLVVMIYKRAEL